MFANTLAQFLRSYLQQAVAKGDLPKAEYKVRVHQEPGHGSAVLGVVIQGETSFPILNPYAVMDETFAGDWHTPQARKALEKVRKIVRAVQMQFDSNALDDLEPQHAFDFYVEFDWFTETKEEEEILAASMRLEAMAA